MGYQAFHQMEILFLLSISLILSYRNAESEAEARHPAISSLIFDDVQICRTTVLDSVCYYLTHHLSCYTLYLSQRPYHRRYKEEK